MQFLKKLLGFFNKLSLKKKVITITVIVVILAILNNTVFAKKESEHVTESAKLATIVQTVSETGNVDSGGAVNVVSPSTGFIDEVYIENGASVKTGDILLKIISTATEQERQASYSNYLTALSTLNAANATAYILRSTMLSKWKTFYDLATNSTYEEDYGKPKTEARTAVEFHTTQDDWLAAEKKYKDQQTTIAQAQADVNSKWILYQATQNAEVKATADGQIVNLSIVKGGSVKMNDNILIILPQQDVQFIKVAINEIDIPKIKTGQNVEIEVDAIEDKKFAGEVVRVDSVGVNTQGVITYNVFVKLLKKDPRIKAQMTTNVKIETEIANNALSVSSSAVKLYQGGRAVQILEGGKSKYIPVRIGLKGDERTQILEGIKEGQEVIIGAKNVLVPRRGPFGF